MAKRCGDDRPSWATGDRRLDLTPGASTAAVAAVRRQSGADFFGFWRAAFGGLPPAGLGDLRPRSGDRWTAHYGEERVKVVRSGLGRRTATNAGHPFVLVLGIRRPFLGCGSREIRCRGTAAAACLARICLRRWAPLGDADLRPRRRCAGSCWHVSVNDRYHGIFDRGPKTVLDLLILRDHLYEANTMKRPKGK